MGGVKCSVDLKEQPQKIQVLTKSKIVAHLAEQRIVAGRQNLAKARQKIVTNKYLL